MKNLRRASCYSKQLMSPLLICSVFFLIMCPFAHSLFPCSQAPVLIPQKHLVENGEQQKGHCDSPLYHTCHTLANLPDYQRCDKTVNYSFTALDQEGFQSLSYTSTTRLIL